ncbi:Rbbp9 [Symbiodinium natans]|uniref:Rbbp9 protein n=1 Tax=Symbiodinium natans TaxID=878477 RepID=A0A812MBM6_9DINO|nr:Rbbp9 [Symbiodinium natans]
MSLRTASHQVVCEEDLEKVASKAPRAVVLIPDLADEDSPEGWQVLGETPQRVEASVREMLEKALHDLQHEIPEEFREHPAVKEQCSKLRDLLSARQPFSLQLRDVASHEESTGSMEGTFEGSERIPTWVEAFLEGHDLEDHGASEWKDAIQAVPSRALAAELGSASSLKRCVIAPGNGCSPIQEANWYAWLASSLKRSRTFEEVHLRDFPDPDEAKREIWVKFLQEDLAVGPDTVLVGHSSGAQAAMRFAEQEVVGGLVLVAACHSDLGDALERASGYYPPRGGPWNWAAIRRNTGWIVQFHSEDDPLVPVSEGRAVAQELQSEYIELKGRSHFFEPCEELLEVLCSKMTRG